MCSEKAENMASKCSIWRLVDRYRASRLAKEVRDVQREVLLGAKSLIDWRLERLDQRGRGPGKAT